MDSLDRNTLHFSDRLTQTVGAGGTAIDQLVVQEAVARFLVGEGKNVVDRPCRPGARSQVEFNVVFVLVEPRIEQERLELHASTSNENRFLLLILYDGAGMIFFDADPHDADKRGVVIQTMSFR